MSELDKKITAIVQGSSCSDRDQRSALGMARTWVEKQKEPFYNPTRAECRLRDNLTRELITALLESGCNGEEMAAALAAARKTINAPFKVDSFVGTAGLKPKEQKKAEA